MVGSENKKKNGSGLFRWFLRELLRSRKNRNSPKKWTGQMRRFHARLAADPWRYIYRMFTNGMRAINLGANAVGMIICVVYSIFLDDILDLQDLSYYVYLPVVMFAGISAVAMSISKNWGKDFKKIALAHLHNQQIEEKVWKRAQREIMDFPVMTALVSLGAWLTSAVCVPMFLFFFNLSGHGASDSFSIAIKVFVGITTAGVATATIILFMVEVICQSLRPYFFREGELAHNTGLFRVDLRKRLFISFILTSLLPMLLLAVLSFSKVKLMLDTDPGAVVQSLFNLTVFILVTAVFLSYLINHLLEHSILDPVEDLEEAMIRVENGDFSIKMSVTSNDEIGALAARFNSMTEALKEGARMRNSLVLAREVQQNLLPEDSPRIPGLDIAGKSLYCDETGGDYYDFIVHEKNGRLSLIIADVSEHGVSSALLMASTRALIREYSLMKSRPEDAVSAVNRVLARDVGESGRFVTLGLALLDLERRKMTWVSAGHDPAVYYDPKNDQAGELNCQGPALGLLDSYEYKACEHDLIPGHMLIMATDGVWEARNEEGEQFGKNRLAAIIRENRDLPARKIVDLVMEAVTAHCAGRGLEDDVTLVLVKIAPDF